MLGVKGTERGREGEGERERERERERGREREREREKIGEGCREILRQAEKE